MRLIRRKRTEQYKISSETSTLHVNRTCCNRPTGLSSDSVVHMCSPCCRIQGQTEEHYRTDHVYMHTKALGLTRLRSHVYMTTAGTSPVIFLRTRHLAAPLSSQRTHAHILLFAVLMFPSVQLRSKRRTSCSHTLWLHVQTSWSLQAQPSCLIQGPHGHSQGLIR